MRRFQHGHEYDNKRKKVYNFITLVKVLNLLSKQGNETIHYFKVNYEIMYGFTGAFCISVHFRPK